VVPASRFGEFCGRGLDLSLALLALLLLAVPILVIALLIRLRMGAPIIFRAVRAGRGGRPFVVYKFRTMLDLRDPSGRLLADEDRITGLGRFLRRTSLDELPQLYNVIRGEMSLVGPRPLLVDYLDLYSPAQARRHEVPPGITGWAQVNGRNGLSWEEKFDLDIWYVDHVSFLLDLKILARTIRQVILREGVNAEGDLAVPLFMGSTAIISEEAPPVPSTGTAGAQPKRRTR
jgi:lipopolysaccharide/colanic/teichoic acid biosynthesis glycosyltransferase